MSVRHSISIFFPAYNDEGTITSLVTGALALLPKLTDDFEVVVVNDGSTDSTPVLLDELACSSPQVRVIHHPSNRGYGGAIRTGLTHTSKDLIFYTDGDGQYDVQELQLLLPLMTERVDVVNGYKRKRADKAHRKIIGGAYNRLARLLFKIPISDVDCDFRLMRRSSLQQIDLVSSSGVICVELVYKLRVAGAVFAEHPVHHYPRLYGRSQFFTLRRVARTARDFFGLWCRLVLLRGSNQDLQERQRGIVSERSLAKKDD